MFRITRDMNTVSPLERRAEHNIKVGNNNHFHSSFFCHHAELCFTWLSLSPRAYQRSATQRLLRSILREWHEASSQSLCSAVQHFAQQLGLQQLQETGDASAEENSSALYHSLGEWQHFVLMIVITIKGDDLQRLEWKVSVVLVMFVVLPGACKSCILYVLHTVSG